MGGWRACPRISDSQPTVPLSPDRTKGRPTDDPFSRLASELAAFRGADAKASSRASEGFGSRLFVPYRRRASAAAANRIFSDIVWPEDKAAERVERLGDRPRRAHVPRRQPARGSGEISVPTSLTEFKTAVLDTRQPVPAGLAALGGDRGVGRLARPASADQAFAGR